MEKGQDIRQAFQQVKSTIWLQRNREQDNRAVRAITSEFKENYRDFYNNDMPVSKHATQLLWHKMILSKTRMQNNGIEMRVDLLPMQKGGADIEPTIIWSDDGKYVSANVKEPVVATRTFLANGVPLMKLKDNEAANYTVIESLKAEGVYVCPNCGAQGTVESLLDGCDYCTTKYTLEDFSKRVSAFGFSKDAQIYLQLLAFKMLRIFFIIIGIAFVVGFLLGFVPTIIMPRSSVLSALGSGILGGILAAGWTIPFVGIVAFLTYLIISYVRAFSQTFSTVGGSRKRNNFINKVRKHDPLFSIENFEGNLENKLISVHYADNFQSISSFVKCDLNPIIHNYANVMYCLMEDVQYLNYWVDESFQIVQLQAKMKLYVLGSDRMKQEKETIQMTMIKRKEQVTQEVCDKVVFTCSNCGGSINLLNGGLCDHCKTSLVLENYDWVITDYQIKERK